MVYDYCGILPMKATPRPQRLFTEPLELNLPLDLKARYPLPEGAEYKGLSVDRLYIHYQHGRTREYQFPASMRSFGKFTLEEQRPDGPKSELTQYFITGALVDEGALELPGMLHSVRLRLAYDPESGQLYGDYDLVHTDDPGKLAGPESPIRSLSLGLALRYVPAN